MRIHSGAAVLLPLLALAASEAASAQAQDFAPFASATATWSDNAARTTNAPVSATALDGLVGLQVVHNSPVLYVSGQVSELQRIYLQGHLPDQTIPAGNLDLVLRPDGEVFSWTVIDTLGQIANQPFAALLARDRQTLNVLSTGPDFHLRFDGQNHLDLSGRYGYDHYGNSLLNDHSYEGRAAFAHDLGTTGSQIGAVYDYRRIEYGLSTLGTAQIQEAYGEYRLAGARTYVVVQAGEDTLEQTGSRTQSTPHLLGLLQRKLSETLTFEGGYVHRYTTPGEAFVTNTRDAFHAGSDQTVQPVALPFEQSYGYVNLRRSQGRLRLAAELTAGRESYPSQAASERHFSEGNLAADYQLSSRMSCSLQAGYFEQTLLQAQENQHWTSVSAGLNRQLRATLRLTLGVMRTTGTGNVPNASFTENRAWVVLTYQPGAERLQRVYDANAPLRLYDRPVVTTPSSLH